MVRVTLRNGKLDLGGESVPKNGQEDIDPEVDTTAANEEDSERRNWLIVSWTDPGIRVGLEVRDTRESMTETRKRLRTD